MFCGVFVKLIEHARNTHTNQARNQQVGSSGVGGVKALCDMMAAASPRVTVAAAAVRTTSVAAAAWARAAIPPPLSPPRRRAAAAAAHAAAALTLATAATTLCRRRHRPRPPPRRRHPPRRRRHRRPARRRRGEGWNEGEGEGGEGALVAAKPHVVAATFRFICRLRGTWWQPRLDLYAAFAARGGSHG